MPTASTIDISEARKQFNTLDQRLLGEKFIIVTRHNKEAFAIVDIEYLSAVLETIEIISDPVSYEKFKQSLEDIKHGRVHDHEDVKRELG